MLPTVNAVIAHVESAGRPWACRFEPLVFGRIAGPAYAAALLACASINKCSRDTAEVLCSTSWGTYQIMGYNLYMNPINLDSPIGVYLGNTDLQDQTFEAFLREKSLDQYTTDQLLNDSGALMNFARAYNGPGDPLGYGQLMKNAISALTTND